MDASNGISRLRKSTIVIVEDHQGIRKSLRQWLSSVFQGPIFIDTESAEEAIEIIKANKPDIVLMDIKLKVMSGIDATKIIKDIISETRVVILTVYDTPAFKDAATKAGASAFVSKSNMYTDLIPVITEILGHPADGNGTGRKNIEMKSFS